MPDWPLSPTAFELFVGMRPGREPSGAGTLRGGSLSTVRHAWTRPGTEDFLGARQECQGWAEPSPAPPRL